MPLEPFDDVPDVPVIPDVPAVPLVPEGPVVPEVADVPLVPDLPEEPVIPDVPAVPLRPTTPLQRASSIFARAQSKLSPVCIPEQGRLGPLYITRFAVISQGKHPEFSFG